MSELSIISRRHVTSVPGALKALIAMEKQLNTSKTYEQIRKVVTGAEAIKLLFKDVNVVKQEAEDVILSAHARIGEEIKKVPKAKGGGQLGKNGSRSQSEIHSGRSKTGISKDTRSRYQKLADAKPKIKEIAKKLRAEGKDATVTAVVREITQGDKKQSRAKKEKELAAKIKSLPDKRYGVVYADPPWKFEPYSKETGMDRAADNHYPTMTLQAIKKMKIPAAKDCVLFLWATSPMLPQALEVMDAWGFKYKSCCVWIKQKVGTGYWFRNKHEFLLVGTRGNIPAPAPGSQYESTIDAPQGKHSFKPFVFRDMIEKLFPTLPRVELFARAEYLGRYAPRDVSADWDLWGNE